MYPCFLHAVIIWEIVTDLPLFLGPTIMAAYVGTGIMAVAFKKPNSGLEFINGKLSGKHAHTIMYKLGL